MKPKHSHSHCCEHTSVKYCRVCQVVHCLDCSKEWRSNVFTTTYQPWTGQLGYLGGNSYLQSTLSNTAAFAPETKCLHVKGDSHE